MSNINMDDERAAFEAWWLKDVPEEHKGAGYALLKNFGEGYAANERCSGAWLAWQARAASPQATATQPVRQSRNCQSGDHDICKAAKWDGVCCAEGECDIDEGIRKDRDATATQPAQTARAAEYRVGWFKSSSNPRKRVRCLFEGDGIAEAEKHHSFIEWCDACNLPAAAQPASGGNRD